MKNRDFLHQKLMQFGCENKDTINNTLLQNLQLSYLQVRDRILLLGNILEEDEPGQIYVVLIKTGVRKMNSAIFALHLCDGNIEVSGYAKEGLLCQKSYEKAYKRLEEMLCQKKESKQPKTPHIKKRVLIAVLLTLVIVFWLLNFETVQIIDAIKSYNFASLEYNQLSNEYEAITKESSVDNIDGIPLSYGKLSIENETTINAISVLFGSNSKKKIMADTATVYKLIGEMAQSIKIAIQIINPTEQWVTERLQTVGSVTGMQAVTQEHNPDGLLKQEGGYEACIYFSMETIDQGTIPGDDIVSKGTDAGGAIEIYKTRQDAEARCEYLSQFDGTLLYSGSYAIIGTIVIRTSYTLSNEEQFTLTSQITEALTAVKAEEN